jgi:hypothetical protein
MSMTAARIRILENQQSGVAKKVYSAVPINEIWPIKQIAFELQRQGIVRDLSIVEGCLNSLKDTGLIKEASPGCFQRVKPRAEPKPAKKESAMATTPAAPSSQPVDPVDKLAAIATKMRGLSQMFLELADDIDEAALALDEKASGNDEELAKLRQLKGLLKSLS